MNKFFCWNGPPYPRLQKTFILIYVVQSCNKILLLKTRTDVSIVFLWYVLQNDYAQSWMAIKPDSTGVLLFNSGRRWCTSLWKILIQIHLLILDNFQNSNFRFHMKYYVNAALGTDLLPNL